jgi:hypothetical protein
MFSSAEIRWFYPGHVPPEVMRWFKNAGIHLNQQPERIDYYLEVPQSDFLGLKFREGRVELKQRYGEIEKWRCHDSVIGWIEYWTKWGYEVKDLEAARATIRDHPGSWNGVVKNRSLHLYEITDRGRISGCLPGIFPPMGCGWEVTQIRLEGDKRSWWSMGFEAFGPAEKLRYALLEAINHVMPPTEVIELAPENSYGYPHWLNKVINNPS